MVTRLFNLYCIIYYLLIKMSFESDKFAINCSNSTTKIDSFYFYEVEQFTVLWLLLIFIVAGNIGVIITLAYSGSRKSRMNYFITHLAVADLSVGVINVLTDIIWRITVTWYAGNVACKIIKYLQAVVTYASTYVLVALSIDRYDAITHPMKFSGSWKRAKYLIGTAWLMSCLHSIPILIFYEEKLIEGQLQCWIEFSAQWMWKVYMTLVAISLFIIPATIITTCYTIIIITIWSKSANTSSVLNRRKLILDDDNSKRVSSRGLIPRAKVKTIKITLVIVTVFILCWSPYIIFDILQVFGHIPKTQTYIAMASFVQSLAPLNSAANPFIYCIFSTHFYKTLCDYPLLRWLRCKKIHQDMAQKSNPSSSLSEFLTNNTSRSRNSDARSIQFDTHQRKTYS